MECPRTRIPAHYIISTESLANVGNSSPHRAQIELNFSLEAIGDKHFWPLICDDHPLGMIQYYSLISKLALLNVNKREYRCHPLREGLASSMLASHNNLQTCLHSCCIYVFGACNKYTSSSSILLFFRSVPVIVTQLITPSERSARNPHNSKLIRTFLSSHYIRMLGIMFGWLASHSDHQCDVWAL